MRLIEHVQFVLGIMLHAKFSLLWSVMHSDDFNSDILGVARSYVTSILKI